MARLTACHARSQVDFARQLRQKRFFVIWDGANPTRRIAENMRQAARDVASRCVGAASSNRTRAASPTLPETITIRKRRGPDRQRGATQIAVASAIWSRVRPGREDFIAGDGFTGGRGWWRHRRVGHVFRRTSGYRTASSRCRERAGCAVQADRGESRATALRRVCRAGDGDPARRRLLAPTAPARRWRRELLTDVHDGILGDIRFDQFGDLRDGPVTVFRVVGKRAVVDRVLTVDSASAG